MTKVAERLMIGSRIAVALHNANAEIRYRRLGDTRAADHAHDTVVDMIESAEYPNATLRALARRLGRHRSLAIHIDCAVVDLALAEGRA